MPDLVPGDEPALVARWKKETLDKTFFMRVCAPSPYHWHFYQAYMALKSDLFLPGLTGLLNGIEVSLRTTICVLEDRDIRGDQGKTMSNSLLRHALELGIDVTILQIDDEIEFLEKLPSNRRKDAVNIVRLRHDVCHGNVTEFFQWVDDTEIFTPECLGPISAKLLDISYNWVLVLAQFLQESGLREKFKEPIEAPPNPLAKWLGR